MPFDIAEFQIPAEVTEAEPFDYRTFTPGHDGLRKLAWVLRHPEVWPRGHVWSYWCHGRCAMGIAGGLWPAALPRDNDGLVRCNKMARAFSMREREAYELFLWQNSGSSADDIADAIDSYLARAEALAKSEAGGTP